MKQSLRIGLGQQLRMTPQLQQAIRLLQLSSIDLQQEIQECLYSNPLLEVDENPEIPDETGDIDAESPKVQVEQKAEDFEYSSREGVTSSQSSVNDFPVRDDAAEESLKDHLCWQLNLATMSPLDREIGLTIIDAVDNSGLLSSNIEDLMQSVTGGEELKEDDVLSVLYRIQRFDPPGIAARNLKECLLLQLSLLPETGAVETAVDLVERHLEALTKLGLEGIAKRIRRPAEEIEEAYQVIKSLNPKPGYSFSSENSDYIVPDLSLVKKEGIWTVILNNNSMPKLRLNEQYANMVKETDQPQTRDYLRSNLQEAKWFLRSIESRNDTLLRVGQAIVEYQMEFFEEGEQFMKPLILKDIAEKLELHESTISRATSQKYMASPRGVFELKYFFSSQLATSSGGECSSTAIRALISKLVKAENPKKPFSDNALAAQLAEEGIVVARRTIAKYREMLSIPPSSQRKRLMGE
jgi:RNA polymerase sigma-54 factor|tara:strand:- start:95906 stop:97306 length:1401 start_codon:yes stop_codon:yes gene_type:complete